MKTFRQPFWKALSSDAGNAWIEKCKQEGKDVTITEINEEHLNSLLE